MPSSATKKIKEDPRSAYSVPILCLFCSAEAPKRWNLRSRWPSEVCCSSSKSDRRAGVEAVAANVPRNHFESTAADPDPANITSDNLR